MPEKTKPKQSKDQRETVGRVMHEFKHGELKSATGGKVTNPKQAVAIGLSEAGASYQQSPAEKRRAYARTRLKEAKGETAMQEKERKAAKTRTELYEEARRKNIPGRSKMDRDALERALHQH
jgi:hypothetical protein